MCYYNVNLLLRQKSTLVLLYYKSAIRSANSMMEKIVNDFRVTKT